MRNGVLSDCVIGHRRELVIANYADEHRAAAETLEARSIERPTLGRVWHPGDQILMRDVWRGRVWDAVPVTVVAHDVSALGHAAAELLFARVQGDQSPPRKVVLPVQLVARGSGEVAP